MFENRSISSGLNSLPVTLFILIRSIAHLVMSLSKFSSSVCWSSSSSLLDWVFSSSNSKNFEFSKTLESGRHLKVWVYSEQASFLSVILFLKISGATLFGFPHGPISLSEVVRFCYLSIVCASTLSSNLMKFKDLFMVSL